MNTLDHSLQELREMDELADRDSLIHRLHPLIKLLTAITFLLVVVSFHKYDFSRLIVLLLYPVLVFQLSHVPLRTCFYKMRYVMPLVCAVGIFNPLFDREILLQVGKIAISGGVLSMLTLMLKGILCLMASFLLMATTRIDEVCGALRMLHVPAVMVSLLLLTYRYVAVFLEEAAIMSEAYALRAPGQKGIHYRAWGSFLGQLLLRSMDRAEELYSAMQLRGYHGEFSYVKRVAPSGKDWIFFCGWMLFFLLCRSLDLSALLGKLVLSFIVLSGL